ncbi:MULTISPECIES: hypothetical protein [Serratia]|uniref:hypothetical protein n=1 Tax=Serratia TaxID=613 RepID=UPI000ADB8F39|nr:MULTISPECIES: hypothetical protein [Serratia]
MTTRCPQPSLLHPGSPLAGLLLTLLLTGCAAPAARPDATPDTGRRTVTALPLTPARPDGAGTPHREPPVPSASPPETPGEARDALASPLPPGLKQQLQTCLFEAKQLAALDNGAYRQQVAALYRQLQAARYYASIAAELSAGTTDTITPLYQYKVNDACHGISQSLLTELKKGSLPARSKGA